MQIKLRMEQIMARARRENKLPEKNLDQIHWMRAVSKKILEFCKQHLGQLEQNKGKTMG